MHPRRVGNTNICLRQGCSLVVLTFLSGNIFSHLNERRYSEDQVDLLFAESVKRLWTDYTSELLGNIRKAQEAGLASILKTVLLPKGSSARWRKAGLNSHQAYERILSHLLSDSQRWCAQAAERWREWVVLCLMASIKRIHHQCNYRVRSQVQSPVTGSVDPKTMAQLLAQMAVKSGMTTEAFKACHASVSRRVGRFFSLGEQDRVFKGKWYAALLDEDIQRLMWQSEYDKAGFPSRVTAAVAATLTFSAPWVQNYSRQLAALLNSA